MDPGTKQIGYTDTLFEPLEDMLILEEIKDRERIRESGIVLPDGIYRHDFHKAIVIACGPWFYGPSGTIVPMDLKVGDKILYNIYSSSKLDISEKEYRMLNRTKNVFGRFA